MMRLKVTTSPRSTSENRVKDDCKPGKDEGCEVLSWPECRTVMQELSSNTEPPNLMINLLIKLILVIAN